jgi:DNA-binding response OmpR family regulator
MRLLLLEDDYLYRVTLQDYLIAKGYEVDVYENGTEALNAIYQTHYAILLLDIRVPGKDGYEVLKELRENGVMTPVIMLTSLVDIEDLSLGYELGCSDYLRKPFELKELQYRIEQIIKADLYRSSTSQVSIGERFSFDIANQLLYCEEEEIDLSAIETKLVSALLQNQGYYLSLDRLQDEVWEGKEVSYADIRMCINRVRQKCGKSFIETKKMVGYRIAK